MSIDALAYGTQGRTGRFGQVDALSISTWGKVPKITAFIIGLPLGVTLEIDSEVIRIFDVNSETCRDFLILARDDGNSLFTKEIISGVYKNFDFKSEVFMSYEIESIVEVEDGD